MGFSPACCPQAEWRVADLHRSETSKLSTEAQCLHDANNGGHIAEAEQSQNFQRR